MSLNEAVITLPAQVFVLKPVLAFIRETAASCGFPAAEVQQIELASEEAIVNIIQHAYEGRPGETFQVTINFSESDFRIVLHEKGMPYDPQRIVQFDPGQLKDDREPEGLGFHLMKQSVDEVLFENLGRGGKLLTLIKHNRKGHIGTLLKEAQGAVSRRPAVNPETMAVEVRPFQPEDALEISRCAYKSYGYTYEPFVYYPEKIREMNRKGTLQSHVAVNQTDGAFIGHFAFKFEKPGDPIAEIGVAFINPQYRKFGIFNLMNDYAHDKALEMKLFGYFARSVISHVASQAAAQTQGGVVCGALLGIFPDNVDFKALTGKIKQKESGLLMYRFLRNDGPRRIFPPARDGEKIRELLEACDLPLEIDLDPVEPASGLNEMTVNVIQVLNIAEIVIQAAGVGIVPAIESTWRDLCLKRVDAIFMHIDLEDPHASFVAEACEKMGFFFSGVLPFGRNGRHELILQYLNNLEIRFDLIKPYSDAARELFRYVQESANRSALQKELPQQTWSPKAC